jgi:hypothetical protein
MEVSFTHPQISITIIKVMKFTNLFFYLSTGKGWCFGNS